MKTIGILGGSLLASLAAISGCAQDGASSTESPSTEAPAAVRTLVASTAPGGVDGVDVPVLDWKACGDPGWQCATAQVPLDYANPKGQKITLALTRLPASDQAHRIGSLFWNPGGPGGTVVDNSEALSAYLAPEVLQRFDFVGVDPRGVGQSTPKLDCWHLNDYAAAFAQTPGTAPDDPINNDGLNRALTLGKQFIDACNAKSADILPYMGTQFIARDLDVIRAAVGDDKMTYWGLSYGTYIGEVYANMFPNHLRAMALDGTMDAHLWTDSVYKDDDGQYAAAESSLGRFLDWCKATPDQCLFGKGDPVGALDALIANLDAHPIKAADGSFVANGATFVYNLETRLASGKGFWIRRSNDLIDAQNGTGRLVAPLTEDDAEEWSVNVVVECNDRNFPIDFRLMRDHLSRDVQNNPRLGPAYAYGPPAYDQSHAAVCSQWNTPRLSSYDGPWNAPGTPPILVVGEVGDPDVPYQEAVGAAATMENAHLLTVKSNEHTGVYYSKCDMAAVSAYLLDLTLPAPGFVCDDEPAPHS